MLDGKIRRDDLLGTDRDIKFFTRLNDDAGQLMDAGLPHEMVKRVLGSFDYVKAYVQLPENVYQVKALPKGVKWSSAIKLKTQKYDTGKKYSKAQSTFWFLPIDNDLYMKPWTLPGFTEDYKTVCIYNWRDYTVDELFVGVLPPFISENFTDNRIAARTRDRHIKENYKLFTKIGYQELGTCDIVDALTMFWKGNGLKIFQREPPLYKYESDNSPKSLDECKRKLFDWLAMKGKLPADIDYNSVSYTELTSLIFKEESHVSVPQK